MIGKSSTGRPTIVVVEQLVKGRRLNRSNINFFIINFTTSLSSRMANNRHAYQDYSGPRIAGVVPPKLDQQEEENPLDALGAWQEGGPSLAPPCGSSVPFIHAMLDFASVSKTDVLYDVRYSSCVSRKTVNGSWFSCSSRDCLLMLVGLWRW